MPRKVSVHFREANFAPKRTFTIREATWGTGSDYLGQPTQQLIRPHGGPDWVQEPERLVLTDVNDHTFEFPLCTIICVETWEETPPPAEPAPESETVTLNPTKA